MVKLLLLSLVSTLLLLIFYISEGNNAAVLNNNLSNELTYFKAQNKKLRHEIDTMPAPLHINVVANSDSSNNPDYNSWRTFFESNRHDKNVQSSIILENCQYILTAWTPDKENEFKQLEYEIKNKFKSKYYLGIIIPKEGF